MAMARFVKPMELLSVPTIPLGRLWSYEVKIDGYRMEAVRRGGQVVLYSSTGKVMTSRYPVIAEALKEIPDEVVIDGELAAVDETGRPRFNLLQNYKSTQAHVVYFPFDMLFYQVRT
jgi:ATP-dependent DNA ligase